MDNKYLWVLIGLGTFVIFQKQILSFLDKQNDKFFQFLMSDEATDIVQSETFRNFAQTKMFDKYLDTLSNEQISQLTKKLNNG